LPPATPSAGAIVPLIAQVHKLEAQITDLKSRPRGLKYCGVWRYEEGPYVEGDVVSEKGAMWIATAPRRSRPGESPDWSLSLKAARDGKDAR
jgi:hypothetical protein